MEFIHSPFFHALIFVKWLFHIYFLEVQMIPLHLLSWGCWVYNVVNSTMFWVPSLRRSISPSKIVQLYKTSSLLASIQRVNEDRVVTSSIWSLIKGINVPQRCRDRINGRTSLVHDIVDSTTSDLDNEYIQSRIVYALICIKWFLNPPPLGWWFYNLIDSTKFSAY